MSFIDIAITAIPVAMVLHMALGLVLKYGLWKANGRTFHPQKPGLFVLTFPEEVDEIEEQPQVEVIPPPAPVATAAATISRPEASLTITVESVEVESEVKVETPDYPSMKVTELRKECSAQGIRWKNAHGQNKHLTKKEMLATLMA